jgi:hypothetical protein
MKMVSLLRRSLIGLCGAGIGLACMFGVSRSDEVSARVSALGLVIHDADETLARFCHEEDGTLWLVLSSGARFELVTSTRELPNPGDGAFHAFDESTVRAALSTVRFPLRDLAVEIYNLPYPRRDATQTAAGPELILLSPGVMPLSAEQQHAAVVHELGHVIQYRYMPDELADLWHRYRSLRGITDEQRYSADAAHVDRPHEIFAEDFRALFGGALANYSGTIENAALCAPQSVAGLDAFVSSLESAPPANAVLAGFPNPSRGAVRFRRSGASAAPVDLFDLAGRRVASVEATPLSSGWQWRWDGRDGRGQDAEPGVYFARERGASSSFRFVIAR